METEEVLASGYYERIGVEAFLTYKKNGEKHKFENKVADHKEAIIFVMDKLVSEEYGVVTSLDEIIAIGHRVVHGGEKFKNSVIITQEVINQIKECSSLAPLHNPPAILGIEACQKVMPNKPMVAVFDTSFHQTMSKERYVYPIPYRYYRNYSVRKYGFHGTSHKYVANRVAEMMKKDIKDLKIVNCHLGQGASLCAIQNGKSVETTMGLTPLGGIPMGSRCGDLDPSVVTYIMEKENLSPTEINNILNKESGLYGVSEISPDARDIEAGAKEGNENAQLALDVYHYLVACNIAKCVVAMNGVDVITFTAGTGERGRETRKILCDYLKFLGVELDEERNQAFAEEAKISSDNSKVEVYVVPTNEELMIAKETVELVK